MDLNLEDFWFEKEQESEEEDEYIFYSIYPKGNRHNNEYIKFRGEYNERVEILQDCRIGFVTHHISCITTDYVNVKKGKTFELQLMNDIFFVCTMEELEELDD